jgi:hypothetical protein
MKIYITRKSASSIYSRGLEALQVWFRKPHFQLLRYGDGFSEHDSEKDGYGLHGMWQHRYEVAYGPYQKYVCFSEMFGFIDREDKTQNKISTYVWEKLREHFHYEEFEEWEKLEALGKSKLEEFYLELNIDIFAKELENYGAAKQ